jgi:hypothetical protein
VFALHERASSSPVGDLGNPQTPATSGVCGYAAELGFRSALVRAVCRCRSASAGTEVVRAAQKLFSVG